MHAKWASLSLALACGLTAGSGFAQQLGDDGTFAIGVDRLFGYVSDVQSYDITVGGGAATTTTHIEQTNNNFSLLGHVVGVEVAQVPRLSFDAFVASGLTIGGSIMYDHYSTGSSTNWHDSPDKTSTGAWLFAPRVGFAKMFVPQFGIWPRAGIMYLHTSTDDTTTNTNTGASTTNTTTNGDLYFTLDANVILAPVPHFAFTLGPTYELLLSSSVSYPAGVTNTDSHQKEHAIGLQAGIFAWF
jgi:hypothetical protein